MSAHIDADKNQIAETILLPGDPLRAKWIAETYLDEVVCYSEVRGMLGFTGNYKGEEISVQGTGMGIPSAMIYMHELINDYGVKNLVRVGSAGSFQPDLNLYDIVVAMSASTTSAMNKSVFGQDTFAPTADGELFMKAMKTAKEQEIPVQTGNILSADLFYDEPDYYKKWADHGVLCVEMEAAGLYSIAAKHNVKALAILTISDSLVSKKEISKKDRERSFNQMMEIALNIDY